MGRSNVTTVSEPSYGDSRHLFNPRDHCDIHPQRAGGRATFPQIFIGDRHIGGCDEMVALERAGELDPLLQAAA